MAPKTLSPSDIEALLADLHPDWQCSDDGKKINRKFPTKDFDQALAITNLCATVAEQYNHHPDICLGWGYCHVEFTTHSISALSMLDINCAKALDEIIKTV